MKKLTYINLSYYEANRKIWDRLMDKYKTLKSKNTIFGYLWLPLACILFGLIAIFGWLAYLTLLFKDIRFTPHYLRTAIKHNNLTDKQAVEYIDTQKQRYLSSLAFGNISSKEKNRIDACFELLYKEYKLHDTNTHEGVINQLTDIKATVEETHSEIQYISEYTHQTEQKEIALEDEREKLRQKKSRKTYKRGNAKNPEDFESSLTHKQLELLAECCNIIEVFDKTVTPKELEDILLCAHKVPLQTTNARLLSLLFSYLQRKDYIHSEWQSIAAKYVCFRSSYGNNLTRNNDFSTAASAAGTVSTKKEEIILEYLSKIKDIED